MEGGNMRTETIEKILYKIPQVSDVTGYSRSFIYEAIAAGSLKVVRKGRSVRVKAEDLRTWIEDHE
jgi:excisionase family DNA binding protein